MPIYITSTNIILDISLSYCSLKSQLDQLIHFAKFVPSIAWNVGSQIILSTILKIQNNNHIQKQKIYVENSFSLKRKKLPDKLWIISLLSNQLQ